MNGFARFLAYFFWMKGENKIALDEHEIDRLNELVRDIQILATAKDKKHARHK